jgi:hypothetical protein
MSSVPSSAASDQWVLLGAMFVLAAGFGIFSVRAERRREQEERAAGAASAGPGSVLANGVSSPAESPSLDRESASSGGDSTPHPDES